MFERTQTVRVRPLSYADVERLARGETIEAYQAMSDGLMPTTLATASKYPPTATRDTERPYGSPQYAAVIDERVNAKPGTYIADKAGEPVGYKVSVRTRTLFGMESGTTLFTTPEAREAYSILNSSDRVRDDRELFAVEEPEGAEMQTVPIYGSMVTTTVFVKGVDHEEADRIVAQAITSAFPDNYSKLRRHLSRPVHDRRVNVYEFGGGEDGRGNAIALNVLAAETSYLDGFVSGCLVETIESSTVEIGGLEG